VLLGIVYETILPSANIISAQSPLQSYTHRADSITLALREIMRVITGRVLNGHFEPQWRPGVLHFPRVLSLADKKASICEHENPHTDLTTH
jgi:hypothetical protein